LAPFNPNTAKYDPGNAYWLGKAAELAYQSADKIKTGVTGWGFPKFRMLDRENTQGFVAGNSEMIILAFRGTEPKRLADWMTDAEAGFVDGPFGKVHQGFWRALCSVWDDLQSSIAEFQDRGQSLLVTGHSLGAALATLAVARFRAQPSDKPVNGLYTFGQPRTGDRNFARNFDADFDACSFRFVNNNDMVTRVPLRLTGYSHIGTFLYFDANGRLSDDLGAWNRFLDSVKGSIEDLGKLGPDGIRDHSMTHGYLPNLEKNLAVNPLER
jgi:triacylglycerol lipase